MAKSTLKSYIEASAQFTEMPRQQAEAFVKGLVKSGDIRRRDAEDLLQTLLARGRETSDRVTALVQAEVAKQMKALSERFDDLEGRLEALSASLMISIGGGARTAGTDDGVAASTSTEPATATESVAGTADEAPTAEQSGAEQSGAEQSGAEQSSAKKSSVKKSSAKKSSAKKSSAKKSTAKRSGKQSSAKQTGSSDAVGSSGVRKVSTTRPTSSPE